VGLYLSPARTRVCTIERYWSRNEPCESVSLGLDPALFIAASQTFPKTVSELEFRRRLMGRPVELVKGVATSLLYPAHVEIAADSVIQPNAQKPGTVRRVHGITDGRKTCVLVDIKAVHYRDDPILTHALMADHPATSARCSTRWRAGAHLERSDRVGVPGIKGVYAHPAARGGFGMTRRSLEQRLRRPRAAGARIARAQCPGGAYTRSGSWPRRGRRSSNTNQVIWRWLRDATRSRTSTSCARRVDVARSDAEPPEERPYGSKALINACMEPRPSRIFSKRTKIRRSQYEAAVAKWRRLGFHGRTAEALGARGRTETP